MFRAPRPIDYPGQTVGVVLLHAYTGSPNDMNKMARALQAQGYGVTVPLFAGHGTLEPLDIVTLGSPELWWHQAEAAITRMQAQYPRIYVFGLSLGGIFAMRALTSDLELCGGGVFSSPIFQGPDHLETGFLSYARYMYRLAKKPADLERLILPLRQQLGQISAFSHDVITHLALIQRPVFIGQAGEDELIDARLAYRLNEALAQTRVDFRWYPDVGHVITVNAAHHQLEEDIIAFIKENEGLA